MPSVGIIPRAERKICELLSECMVTCSDRPLLQRNGIEAPMSDRKASQQKKLIRLNRVNRMDVGVMLILCSRSARIETTESIIAPEFLRPV